MKITFDWKKVMLVTANVLMAAYLLFAITAFNAPHDERTGQICSQVVIDIKEDSLEGFLTPDEITNILKQNNLYPLAKKMSDVNARHIEEALQKNPFVKTAQCHKAQQGRLCIRLEQRLPLFRVKAQSGEDYFVDSEGQVMPKTNYMRDLVLVTGDLTQNFAINTISHVAEVISGDPFWDSQIVQLNVLEDGSLEMVPRVGDNIIYLGQPTDIEKKLERLKLFYKHGLNMVGWNKYSRISVEYGNQIICKKR